MKFGLTLGGGGARGAAHLGVIEMLERLDIQPQLITGTSIGGMVGAWLAAGYSAADMAGFFPRLNAVQMFKLDGRLPALTSNAKIEALLVETLGRITFADLSIPLSVVATDLISRKAVVIDEGDLISAILATIAIPVVLPPVERNGMMLVDGGTVNNTPFDVAQARGATHVLAVELTNTAPFGTAVDDTPSPRKSSIVERALAGAQRLPAWKVMSAVMDITTNRTFTARMAIAHPDWLLRPELGTIDILDFHRWEEAYEVGKIAALTIEEEIRDRV